MADEDITNAARADAEHADGPGNESDTPQPRDPEAERFIAEKLRQQPYAPYAMAQAIFVQEQALAAAEDRMQQLEAQGQGGGGFLGRQARLSGAGCL